MLIWRVMRSIPYESCILASRTPTGGTKTMIPDVDACTFNPNRQHVLQRLQIGAE